MVFCPASFFRSSAALTAKGYDLTSVANDALREPVCCMDTACQQGSGHAEVMDPVTQMFVQPGTATSFSLESDFDFLAPADAGADALAIDEIDDDMAAEILAKMDISSATAILEEVEASTHDCFAALIQPVLSRMGCERLADILAEMKCSVAALVLREMRTPRAANSMAHMKDETAAAILEKIETETAAGILSEMLGFEAAAILAEMNPDKAVDLLLEMHPRPAAGVLAEMPKRKSAEVLAKMQEDTAASILAEMDAEMVQKILSNMGDDDATLISAQMVVDAEEACIFEDCQKLLNGPDFLNPKPLALLTHEDTIGAEQRLAVTATAVLEQSMAACSHTLADAHAISVASPARARQAGRCSKMSFFPHELRSSPY